MNRTTWIALTVAAVAATAPGWSGLATAQVQPQPKESQPAASPAGAPERIEGTITAIDPASGTVTLRSSDGQFHSFRGNAETLADLKVGDKLELNKRANPAR
jgi:hypothetical protein